MTKHKLGAVQLEIMKLLWTRGGLTAREITDELSAREGLAHSTIQTLLRKLEAKGAVRHSLEGRVFVFSPIWREDEATSGAAHDLLSRMFGGSIYGLVSNLLRSENVDVDELARLRKLIDDAAESRSESEKEETAR
jgi:BlaI family penicillinase repressor